MKRQKSLGQILIYGPPLKEARASLEGGKKERVSSLFSSSSSNEKGSIRGAVLHCTFCVCVCGERDTQKPAQRVCVCLLRSVIFK